MTNSVIAGIFLIVGLVSLYLIFAKKSFSNAKSQVRGPGKYHTIEDKYNAERREKELELDSLLDKIAKNGFHSLSAPEKKRLEQLSGKK